MERAKGLINMSDVKGKEEIQELKKNQKPKSKPALREPNKLFNNLEEIKA